LLEVLHAGDPYPKIIAKGADVRTDLPLYIRHTSTSAEEVQDITPYWSDEAVTFFLGCSFSFEQALQDAGIRLRHVDERKNVAMYDTSQDTNAVGDFSGKLVVSMRPIDKHRVEEAYQLSDQFPKAHGGPVADGDKSLLGIKDLDHPQYGDSVDILDNETPVYWACGMTSQVAVKSALEKGLPWAITHSPGQMFISDLKVGEEIGKSS